MKKLIALVLILTSALSLTGCFEDDSAAVIQDPSQSPNYTKFETTDFSILYPNDWEVLQKDSFTSNVPASTIVIFRNNIKSDLFTANLNISQTTLTQKESLTSEDFTTQTLNTEKFNLVNFQEIKREDFTIGQEKTSIVTFQGRKSVTDTLLNFEQICIARNGFGMIITAAYLPNEDQSVVLKLDEMIRSFTLKNP
jgi:hypothetical protein